MKISIGDTSPVFAGSTAVEAFRTTVELAQVADQAGFFQRWHHAGVAEAGVASKNDEPTRWIGRRSAEPSQPVPRDVGQLTPVSTGSTSAAERSCRSS